MAWKMLTIQPPMIATFPTEKKLTRRFHDKDSTHWDPQLEEYDLVFFHPAVYRTYDDKSPTIQAEVGNRKPMCKP